MQNILLESKNLINNFGFFNQFVFYKREMLLCKADKLSLLIIELSKNNVNQNEIFELFNIQTKLINTSKSSKIVNFICNLFFKEDEIEKLDQHLTVLESNVKKINKLISAKVEVNHLPLFIEENESSKNLNKLIFEDHIYERMKLFNHSFTFNEQGEITFKFSDRTSLEDEVLEDLSEIEEEDREEFWSDLYNDFQNRDLILEIRGEFGDGCYQTISMNQITLEELKNLILLEDESFNKSIQIIHPTKELTLVELEEMNVLEKDEDTNDYYIAGEFQYLENGFVHYPYEDWEHLRPYAYTTTPPKDFTLDIIVHSSPGLPGVFSDQGHVSIKFTTPRGEIYSVGLFPEEAGRDSLDLSLQKGKLVTPDNYIFLPTTHYEEHVMTYTLSNPKAFHQLMRWIESMQGYHKDEEGEVFSSNLFYHPTHQSCAAFACNLRDYALELGAKSQVLSQRKISYERQLGIRIKEYLLDMLLHTDCGKQKTKWNQGIEYTGVKNLNVDVLGLKNIYLPVDLILDHIEIEKMSQKQEK